MLTSQSGRTPALSFDDIGETQPDQDQAASRAGVGAPKSADSSRQLGGTGADLAKSASSYTGGVVLRSPLRSRMSTALMTAWNEVYPEATDSVQRMIAVTTPSVNTKPSRSALMPMNPNATDLHADQ